MSLVPEFEIGVLNAWIFPVYALLVLFLPNLIFNKENMKVPGSQSRTEKRLRPPMVALFFAVSIIGIWLPLKIGTLWFYIGFPIIMVGLVLFTIVSINFATTKLLSQPVTRGLYRYSRHPMYVNMMLLYIGIGIATASWIPLLLAVISPAFWIPLAGSEEEFCLEQYGDAYREYMNRTPRWLGMPKSG